MSGGEVDGGLVVFQNDGGKELRKPDIGGKLTKEDNIFGTAA